MDSYVIRIYRRDAVDPRKCAGLAEVIETEEKKTFKDLDELLGILETRERGCRTGKDAKPSGCMRVVRSNKKTVQRRRLS